MGQKAWVLISCQATACASQKNNSVVSEIGIPTYPKLALHLSQPTNGSKQNTVRQQIASSIRNGKG